MANSSDYYYEKGLSFLNEGNYDEALMYIDKAIEMDKNIGDYWFSKVKCLTELKMYDDALECLDEAIKFNPNNDSIKFNKVDLLCKQADKLINDGKFDEPLQLYDEAISLVPNDEELKYKKVELLCNHANELVENGKFKEPMRLYRKAVRLVPNDETVKSYEVNLLIKQANNLFEDGDFEKSSKYWDKIIKLDSDNPFHYYNKANIILKESNFKEHKPFTKKGIENNLINVRMNQARRFIEIKKFNQAIELLTKTDAFEDEMDIYKLSKKASLLFNCGCFDDSIRCLDKALFELKNKKVVLDSDKKDELEFLARKADCLNYKSIDFEANSKNKEAIKCLDEAMSILPERDSHYCLLLKNKGKNLAKLFQYEEALECFNETYEILNDLDSLYLKVTQLINLKRYDEANKGIDSLIESKSDEINFIKLKIKLLFLTNKIDSSIELCDQTIEKYPHYKYRLKLMRDSLNNIKIIRNALKELNKSIELDDNNNEVLALKNKLKLEEIWGFISIDEKYALDCLNKSEISDDNIDYLYSKGRIFSLLNKLIESEDNYTKALEFID